MYDSIKNQMATELDSVASRLKPTSPLAVELKTASAALKAMDDEVFVAHASEDTLGQASATIAPEVVVEVPAAPAQVDLASDGPGEPAEPYMADGDPQWNEVATRAVMAALVGFKTTGYNPSSENSTAPAAPKVEQEFDTGLANGAKPFNPASDASNAPAAPKIEQEFDTGIAKGITDFNINSEASDAPKAPMPEQHFDSGLAKGAKPFNPSTENSDAPKAPTPEQHFDSGLVGKSQGSVAKSAATTETTSTRTDGEEVTETVYEPIQDMPATQVPSTGETITPAVDNPAPAPVGEGDSFGTQTEDEHDYFGGGEDGDSLGTDVPDASTAGLFSGEPTDLDGEQPVVEEGDDSHGDIDFSSLKDASKLEGDDTDDLDISFDDDGEDTVSTDPTAAPASDDEFSFDEPTEEEETEITHGKTASVDLDAILATMFQVN